MTDEGESLSEIMSDTPAPAVVADTTSTTEAPAPGQTRDEHGRFGPKGEAAPVQQEPAPATTEEQPGAMVPQQALHAARQENGDLKRRLDEMAGQISILTQQRPQPAPQVQAEQPKPDMWADPDVWHEQRTKEALAPIENMFRNFILSQSMQKATAAEGGKELVTAAEQSVRQAMQAGDPDAQALLGRLKSSFDPVGDIVAFHRQRTAISRVGSDPDKFVQSEIDKMLADPTKAGELLKRLQAGATGTVVPPRSTTQLPPSLTRIPGGNASAEGVPTLGEILKSGR